MLLRPVNAAHCTKMGHARYRGTQKAMKNLLLLLDVHSAKVHLFKTQVRPVVCCAFTGIDFDGFAFQAKQ
jgi:hypothetical protein